MGKAWAEQELGNGTTVLDVLEQARQDIRDGDFKWENWDHNSKSYRSGRSNKQIRIAGAMLLNDTTCTQEQAEQAVMEALMGRAPA